MNRARCAVCDRPEGAFENASNKQLLCPSCVVATGFLICGNGSFLFKAKLRGKISRLRRKVVDKFKKHLPVFCNTTKSENKNA